MSPLAGSVSQKEDSWYYCSSASKAAPNTLTRTMVAELRPPGVTAWLSSPAGSNRMGGAQAPLPVEESVRSLAGTIERLSPQEAGQFLDRNGLQGAAAW